MPAASISKLRSPGLQVHKTRQESASTRLALAHSSCWSHRKVYDSPHVRPQVARSGLPGNKIKLAATRGCAAPSGLAVGQVAE